MTNREILCDMGYDDAVIFQSPDYDSAIIGVSEDNRVVYDYNKMIHFLVVNDSMTEEEAADFVSYNTIRALQYISNSPIVIYPLID